MVRACSAGADVGRPLAPAGRRVVAGSDDDGVEAAAGPRLEHRPAEGGLGPHLDPDGAASAGGSCRRGGDRRRSRPGPACRRGPAGPSPARSGGHRRPPAPASAWCMSRRKGSVSAVDGSVSTPNAADVGDRPRLVAVAEQAQREADVGQRRRRGRPGRRPPGGPRCWPPTTSRWSPVLVDVDDQAPGVGRRGPRAAAAPASRRRSRPGSRVGRRVVVPGTVVVAWPCVGPLVQPAAEAGGVGVDAVEGLQLLPVLLGSTSARSPPNAASSAAAMSSPSRQAASATSAQRVRISVASSSTASASGTSP